MTWDSLPIIGPVPCLGKSFFATEHNILGMSLTAATGRLITEMIQERPTHINAEAFLANRFQ